MSKQNNENTSHEIEDKLKNTLSGDALKNALDFVAFLRASGFTLEKNRFFYMSVPTCLLLWFDHPDFPTGYWGIYDCPICEYDGIPLDESLKEFARANVRICKGKCGCLDWPRGGNQTVFGKEFNGACNSVIVFHDPDTHAVEKVKKLMEYWKLIINENAKTS